MNTTIIDEVGIPEFRLPLSMIGCWEHHRGSCGGELVHLRDWHEYPRWKPQNLARRSFKFGTEGVDLLSVISGALSCKLHF
ncbi:hypothetical protein IFM89_026160 [Coptis chinensis]|uniref:Uncharacterized protein n=1 Tax=Coptis chinensis TaxID=261450 RepID=A0A835LVI4_9MAGN|nr:hypothetical protein IFM89_026160 [Coptis chinensis]